MDCQALEMSFHLCYFQLALTSATSSSSCDRTVHHNDATEYDCKYYKGLMCKKFNFSFILFGQKPKV